MRGLSASNEFWHVHYPQVSIKVIQTVDEKKNIKKGEITSDGNVYAVCDKKQWDGKGLTVLYGKLECWFSFNGE